MEPVWLSSGESSGKTDRKRVAARKEGQLEIGATERKRETGDTTAGKEELMKESEIGRKTTCPHVVPRSTGSDNIVPISAIRGGFRVFEVCRPSGRQRQGKIPKGRLKMW